MSYIQFDKNQLINLQYSLGKELIRTNERGAYASSTIIGCNTRKYHGLLVAPQPQIDEDNHVILSTLDETIIQREEVFNLGIHKYPGVYAPKGHRYVKDFTLDPMPKWTYGVGGVVLTKEILLTSEMDCTLLRYTLEDAHSPTRLRFTPFLAFRNYHRLNKANVFVETKFQKIPNGAKFRMYSGYGYLYFQFSKKASFDPQPDWYYNIEYLEERERGYDYQEDLFVPGHFEVPIKKGEQLVISAGLEEINPRILKRIFKEECDSRIPRNSFENCLKNAAGQFIVKRKKRTEITAGLHWFGRWGRDTFIALPGLTLVTGKPETCREAMDGMLSQLKNGLFPNMGNSYNSVDAPLWFFWTLQQYAIFTRSEKLVWKKFGAAMRQILEAFKNGTEHNIHMTDRGLIFAGQPGMALTWMDAVVEGQPITPRIGMPVEINALWYNAVCFSLQTANLSNDKKFVETWNDLPAKMEDAFMKTFWDERKGYLADVVNGDAKDWSVRPNQVFATSLPFSPVKENIRRVVLEKVKSELVTPRGLRTLSPKNLDYHGTYAGDQKTRDRAYHQGTVWPWLLGHFAEGYLKLYGKSGVAYIKDLYDGFAPTMSEHGVSTISEIYEGDPPHKACGAISQAWSVSELLRINYLIQQFGSI